MSELREIGGYFGFENTWGDGYHDRAIAVNSGRSALEYIVRANDIHTIWLPDYLCDSVPNMLDRSGVRVRLYEIGVGLRATEMPALLQGEWLYLVNYFGQLSNDEILAVQAKANRLIVDNTQAFFTEPLQGIDTVYTCRKFFGVPDGGYAYSRTTLEGAMPTSRSAQHVTHLTGRADGLATDTYDLYRENERRLAREPLAQMSSLTTNLMRGFDYERIRERRDRNYAVLHERLGRRNRLHLSVPSGPFAYPLFTNKGQALRSALQSRKVYIPTLWPNVLKEQPEDSTAVQVTQNLLPIPVDQRYSEEDMHYLADLIEEFAQ